MPLKEAVSLVLSDPHSPMSIEEILEEIRARSLFATIIVPGM